MIKTEKNNGNNSGVENALNWKKILFFSEIVFNYHIKKSVRALCTVSDCYLTTTTTKKTCI